MRYQRKEQVPLVIMGKGASKSFEEEMSWALQCWWPCSRQMAAEKGILSNITM